MTIKELEQVLEIPRATIRFYEGGRIDKWIKILLNCRRKSKN